jgi:glycerol-3-phosphate dehydrogenase
MSKIIRDPEKAAKEKYDLIIIGGGIYGAMLSFEASRRGLRSLLLERDDFGQHTSFNSLRIIHGGLRYLQSFDLHRFRESVSERKWFLKTFPHLIKTLPCLMPLYGNGLYHPFVLRKALKINDILSCNRNRTLPKRLHIPNGQIFDTDKTKSIFPSVDQEGLKGAAVWHDAYMLDSQRLLIEIVRRACTYGARALNYVEAHDLLKNQNDVVGVSALDRENNEMYEFKARQVVNASGPWCRDVSARFHKDISHLFNASIAWNVLLDREPLSDYALAVFPKKPGGKIYFLVPWNGKLFAGTGHAPWLNEVTAAPMPSSNQLQEFFNDLNWAVPELNVTLTDIIRIFSGFLPAQRSGTSHLSNREIILNHSDYGGPRGFYSVSGVKYTTARLVAQKTLNRIFPQKKSYVKEIDHNFSISQNDYHNRMLYSFNWSSSNKDIKPDNDLSVIIEEESVQHLDDLMLRRTLLWTNPSKASEIAPQISGLFDWDKSRCKAELSRLKESFAVPQFKRQQ